MKIQGLVMKVATLKRMFKFSFDSCLPRVNGVLQKGPPEPQSVTFGNTVFADVLVKVTLQQGGAQSGTWCSDEMLREADA